MGKENNKGRVSVKTVIKSILSGDILLLLRVDRALPYILFLFILGWANIFLNYTIEQTMVKVEKNKDILEDLKNEHSEKVYKFVKAGKQSNIKIMLENAGSDVTTPEKPARIIKLN
jgi:hypothetical protein